MQIIKIGEWYRTCQECGHKMRAKKPREDKEPTDSYRNAKCTMCRSESLNYGTYMIDAKLNWTE